MKNTQVIKTCERCGSTYKVKAYRSETSRYCSKKCWSYRNPSQPRKCAYCDNIFNSRDKKARFCSRSCSRKSMTGENATAWKGGKSLVRNRAKVGGELAKWRKQVYQRDNYTCQECGNTGGDIHAHHIKSVSEFPEFMLDVNNGQTLCVSCHEKLHDRKFSTPAKYHKYCMDCGIKTTGRSQYCRHCSLKKSWGIGGHLRSINSGKIPVIT